VSFIDDPLYKQIREQVYGHADEDSIFVRHGIIAKTGVDQALDAIPALTLKTEDGRFVKVKPFVWRKEGPGGLTLYRIVEES
jgi:hypothetical protein